jgi:hypothetical protein
VPANERSHDDQPATTARPHRRRLLIHLLVFSIALVMSSTVGSPTASGEQPGRFLSGGTLDVTYTCVGADQNTIDLLTALSIPPILIATTITSGSVEPSPSPGDSFDVPFTWDFTLDPTLVTTAVGLGTTQLDTTGTTAISATSGATGTAAGTSGPFPVVLGDGLQEVGYTQGPFTGTFTRTAAVDEPIVFTPGTLTSSVVTSPSGLVLNITCTPSAGALTVTDQDGVAPSTTTTTRPVITTTTGAPTTTTVAAGAQARALPRTGSSSLIMIVVALGLIDLGYLALTASKPARRRTSTS